VSQLAVKAYVAAQVATASLAGTHWGDLGGTVHPWRQRPKIDKVGTSVYAAIGRCKLVAKRLSVPRGFGQKQRHYVVEVLVYADSSDEEQGGDDFDTLIERIIVALESAAVPAQGIDPTGRTPNSTILSCAEDISAETMDPTLTGAQGRVRFYAVLSVAVTELYTA
jgi:hypothetical protein